MSNSLLDTDVFSFLQKRDICIVGFMGSGKTFLSEILAKELKMQLIETDSIIEQKELMPIMDIFKTKGEKYFRLQEKNLLYDILYEKKNNRIISCGGGLPVSKINRKIMRMIDSFNIFLNPDFETIYNRIRGSKRPLVYRRSRAYIFSLWAERNKAYQSIANITISAQSTDEIFLTLNKRIRMSKDYEGKI
jgi:shikimate kinase